MEPETRARLIEMTAEFYRAHAESFDRSRQGAWDSWGQVLEVVRENIEPTSVFDLGCGNGRFADFLIENGLADVDYLGIDFSERFIELATARYPKFQFVVNDLEGALTTDRRFDVVVAFGLFHHLPGGEYRADVFNRLANLLTPGGLITISLWQPKLANNFENKVAPVQHSDLEENDFLLGWNGDFSALRFCHHFDDAEIDKMIADSPLKLVNQFQGTGNDVSNRLLILK